MRQILPFDSQWTFHKGVLEGAQKPEFDDTTWRELMLPHDWSIEGDYEEEGAAGYKGGYLPLGIGWYRKTFTAPSGSGDGKTRIEFDGIYKNSDVWINGHHLGNQWNGYISFAYDLTPHLKQDTPNVIAVRVDNTEQTCRWYTGSGIYRHVRLIVTDRLHVAQHGTTLTTPHVPTKGSSEPATVNMTIVTCNDYDVPQEVSIQTTVFNGQGREVATACTEQTLDTGEETTVGQEFSIPDPALWSAEDPQMYLAETKILSKGLCVDTVVTPFGIREIRWDSETGLYVNGERVLLKGACIHHDLGCLGAAFNMRAMERRLEILKASGFNAIRTSHNPPAPQLLDLCDRLGLYLIDEAFDKWGGFCYPTFFEDWQTILKSMLARDRNHPCVILWSVGNETSQQAKPEGIDILTELTACVHAEEPTRPVTVGCRPAFLPQYVGATDIAGLNYCEQWFPKYRAENPKQLIISTEAYTWYRGKGDSFKAFHPVNPWLDVENLDYVVGSFLWTGIDYRGEAIAGWPLHGWNGSPIDTCGFRKPVSYLHQSFGSEAPCLRVVVIDDSIDEPDPTKDHWGWPKMASHWNLSVELGKEVQVAAFTNCEAVELFLNGVSLGVKRREDFEDRIPVWAVPWEPGTLSASGVKDGTQDVSHELKTASEATQILAAPDRTTLSADGQDLCHVEIDIVDAEVQPVPDAMHELRFEVEGPAVIAGVDNGDLRSHEPSIADRRSAFHGKCLLVIRSTVESGPVCIQISADGLKAVTMNLEVLP